MANFFLYKHRLDTDNHFKQWASENDTYMTIMSTPIKITRYRTYYSRPILLIEHEAIHIGEIKVEFGIDHTSPMIHEITDSTTRRNYFYHIELNGIYYALDIWNNRIQKRDIINQFVRLVRKFNGTYKSCYT